MRAALVLNPQARSVTSPLVRLVVAALEGRFKLDVRETHAPDAAISIAKACAQDGNELIIAFGGDGLVNEVANGIAGTDTSLAVIPGGTMNVFARNAGIPTDPIDAADFILRSAGHKDPCTMNLASANGRFFTFACGCGFDADAAAFVEEHKNAKRTLGEPYFYATALGVFIRSYSRRLPYLVYRSGDVEKESVMAIALNQRTYAYLLGRPVRLGSHESLTEPKVDILLLRKLRYSRFPHYVSGALLTGKFGPDADLEKSVDDCLISAARPFRVHVDGESIEPTDSVEIRGNASSLKLLA